MKVYFVIGCLLFVGFALAQDEPAASEAADDQPAEVPASSSNSNSGSTETHAKTKREAEGQPAAQVMPAAPPQLQQAAEQGKDAVKEAMNNLAPKLNGLMDKFQNFRNSEQLKNIQAQLQPKLQNFMTGKQ